MNKVLTNFSRLAVCILLAACTSETDSGLTDNPLSPPDGNDLTYQEIQVNIKNQLSVATAGTKAIATADENVIHSLDIYIFGSTTEDGVYSYQERFAYRDNPASLPAGATSIGLTTGNDGERSQVFASLRIKKGLFIKIYTVANNPDLADPTGAIGTGDEIVAGGAKVMQAVDYVPLVLDNAGTTGTDIRSAGVPTERQFLTFHTRLLRPTQTTDVIETPLPMTGAYTTPIDLTDYSINARLTAGFKLTRAVARFDVINDAEKSRFTIENISMTNGRRGANCFPIIPYKSEPAFDPVTDLITYPVRAISANTQQKEDPNALPPTTSRTNGAFYTWPSPTTDEGNIILQGTYRVNLTDPPKPVTYFIPFRQISDDTGAYLEINPNHRYTIAITKADEYHIDFNIRVADWEDAEDIDGFEPVEPTP